MNRVCKILLCILSFTLIISFFGCSTKNADESEIIGGADTSTNIIVFEKTTADEEKESTTVGDLGKSISYVLTEDEAKEKAYAALKNEYENGRYSAMQIGMEAFEFSSIELKGSDEGYIAFNRGYGNTDETENFSGHAYYCVEYKVTTQLCDFAYLCIDAVNGDLLFSGYMGD